MKRLSKEELAFEQHLAELGFRNVEVEFRFHPLRQWRSDYMIPTRYTWLRRSGHPCRGILIEKEGSVWTQGRHTRGAGFIKDMEKYNTAAVSGFILLRFSTQQLGDGTAREFLRTYIADNLG